MNQPVHFGIEKGWDREHISQCQHPLLILTVVRGATLYPSLMLPWTVAPLKNTEKQLHELRKSIHDMDKKFYKEIEILKNQIEMLEMKN